MYLKLKVAAAILFVLVSSNVTCHAAPQKHAQPELVLQLGHRDLSSLAISKDEKWLATNGDGGVSLWDIRRRILVRQWQRSDLCRDLVFLPDSRALACASEKQTYIFDVASGKQLRGLDNAQEKLSRDGSVSIRQLSNTNAELRDARTGKFLVALQSVGSLTDSSEQHLVPFYFSPDKSLIAQAHRGEIRFWNARNGRLWRKLYDPRGDAKYEGVTAPLAFSPNGRVLATLGADPKFVMPGMAVNESGEPRDYEGRYIHAWFVKLWDYRTGKLIKMFPGEASELAFSADGKKLVGATSWDSARTRDIASGKLDHTFKRQSVVAVSANAVLLAGREIDTNTLTVHNALTGKTLWKFSPPVPLEASSMTLSPNNKLLAVSYDDQKTRIWTLQTGRLFKTIPSHKSQPVIAFAADGTTIVTRENGEPTNKLLEKLKPFLPKNNTLYHAFSDDYELLAAGYRKYKFDDKEGIELWNTKTEQMVWRRNEEGAVYPSNFSPNKEILITELYSEYDTPQQLQIRNAQTGAIIRVLETDTKNIPLTTTFSADGSTLAGAVQDGSQYSARIWDVKSGRTKRVIENIENAFSQMALSSNGRLLVITNIASSTKVYDVSSGKLLLTWKVLTSPTNPNTTSWIAYTPDGFYDGSAGIEKWIRWRVGDELLPVAKFQVEKHRPDLVEQALKVSPLELAR